MTGNHPKVMLVFFFTIRILIDKSGACSPAYKLPQYTFTGQFSTMDDPSTAGVTEGFGLYFYNARFYDPYINHFTQPDTLIPNPGNPLAWDRYLYVLANPLRYTDPSGHVACRTQEECEEMGTTPMGGGRQGGASTVQTPPLPNSAKEYEYSYTQGVKFVDWLMSHDGWWSKYVNEPSMIWKFLIALAYGWETSGVYNEQYLKDEAKAFDNKIGYLKSNFGSAGYYIYLGSLQTVRLRVEKSITEPTNLERSFERTKDVWDDSWSMGDNDPFDFANPMPGKHRQDFLDHLNSCAQKYGANCTIQNWRKMNTGYDLINILVSTNNQGGFDIAFIVSYTQNNTIWGK